MLGIASAVATAIDPQGSLYNVRLLPLWFISVYLMAAWAFGTGCIAAAEWWRRLRRRRWATVEAEGALLAQGAPDVQPWEDGRIPLDPAPGVGGALAPRRAPSPRWAPAAVGGAVLGLLVVMVIVASPFVFGPSSLVHDGVNEVTNWSVLNYEGYEAQPSYPEYRSVIETMEAVTRHYGCGRAMWEYSASEQRFGTPEALMLLPYWTSGCVDSMEGLLFESSTTTPFHFLDQAELSAAPSDPEVGLPYGPLDVTLGVQHLQLLGVKYFLAETPEVEQAANADPSLKLVASTGPWAYNYDGTVTHSTWDVYVVRDAPLVTPLRNEPVVLAGVKPSPSSWLGSSTDEGPALAWYTHPSRWNVELAQSGPASWPRTSVHDTAPTVRHVATTRVTAVSQSDSSISFHVSRVGTPVLVKVSYFPNWHASGADGPWRVTPNLMVVVPTSHDVTLTYGRSAANDLGQLATLIGLVALVVLFVVPAVRRRRRATQSQRT